VIAALALSLSLVVSGPIDHASIKPLRLPMPPIKSFPAAPPPNLVASAWMLWSVREDAELGSRDPDTQRPFASITKLMSGILAVEQADLSADSVVSAVAGSVPIGYDGQPDVRTGETWPMYDLLVLTMVGSGNKASAALAEGVSGSVEAFVAEMNAKAAALGLNDTAFTNPHGLDAPGHISTPRDLIDLGLYSLQYEQLLEIMRIQQITFAPGGRQVEVTNTNRLVGSFPGYGGLKTGDTANAGQVLLSYVDDGTGGLVGVVLRSTQRRVDTRELMAWGLGTLGPRDRFYAAASGSQLASSFPAWYQTLMAAPKPLNPGPLDPTEPTPLADRVAEHYLDLVPAILGGAP
jgi:D-alanyl-D-alanine carboxypeptidase (penicillin-binding protein 5/6)